MTSSGRTVTLERLKISSGIREWFRVVAKTWWERFARARAVPMPFLEQPGVSIDLGAIWS
ncbi:hypothetical protein IMZ48_01655 [Candidatus Bathyarchaeota archaeon]|nr:hypothetical protein [Candidatus Bathyarchaeota archaeon]